MKKLFCTLDLNKIYLDDVLTYLTKEELKEVEFKLSQHLSL